MPYHNHAIADVLGLTPALAERGRALGDYVEGGIYDQGAELFDGANLSEAKRDGVTSYPFVTPFGESFPVYDGTMANTPETATQVIFGNRYAGITTPFYLSGYRIFVSIGETYVLRVVVDPLGTPDPSTIISFTATTDGWLSLSSQPIVVPEGTVFDLVVEVTEPPDIPIEVVAEYNYQTPQNAAAPPTGHIIQARSAPETLAISYTDTGGVTNGGLVAGLKIGDTISAADGGFWTVQSNVPDAGGEFAYIGVTPSTVGVAGTQDFTFSSTAAAPIPVAVDIDYWGSSQYASIQGIIAIDLPYGSATYNNNAYGVDITVQEAYIPPAEDWWLKIIGGTKSGTAARVLTTQQQDWVAANTQSVSPYDVLTTDDTWTEVFRGVVGLDMGFKGVIATDAKRLDSPGYYAAVRTVLAYNIAGVVTVLMGDISELGQNLDVRAVEDGTDVVFEVKGRNGQDWSWTTTTEYKEIE